MNPSEGWGVTRTSYDGSDNTFYMTNGSSTIYRFGFET